MHDVGVLELNLLYLCILFGLLVDDFSVNGLELAVEHGLNGRRVFCRLHGHGYSSARNA